MARRGGKGIRTQIVGAQEVMKNLGAAGDRWKRSVAAGLYLEANNLMGLSKRRVPVDLGTLKASGYVTLPVEQGTKILVEAGYGGNGSRQYAAVQHERLDFRHPEGGQAKYLESVVDERAPSIAGNILALAKAHFESGRKGIPKGPMPTNPDEGEGRAVETSSKELGGSKRGRKK